MSGPRCMMEMQNEWFVLEATEYLRGEVSARVGMRRRPR